MRAVCGPGLGIASPGQDEESRVVDHEGMVVPRSRGGPVAFSLDYSGELVEQGSVGDIFRAPRHPYTAALLGCVPKIGADRQPGTVQPIRGRVPALHEAPRGCIFEPRCNRARERCRVEHPGIERSGERTLVRCFFPGSPKPAESTAPDPPLREKGRS